MSRVFQYFTTTNSTAPIDGTMRLSETLRTNPNRRHTLEILPSELPVRIPNVYNYGGTNNGLCRVSNGITTIDIQLQDGVYIVNAINRAINDTINSWYTDSTQPAFQLLDNGTLSKCYIVIDSTKLSVGTQFSIDFAYNGSKMSELLGFTSPSSFNVDGTYSSNVYPQIDWFSYIDVYLEGLGSDLMIVNGESSNKVIHFEFYSTTDNVYYFPKTGQTYEVECKPPSNVNQVSFKFKGRNNRQVICYDSICSINFKLTEY